MNISDVGQAYNFSAKQSVGINNVKNALENSSEGMDTIIKSMDNSGVKSMEKSVTPYKGSSIDARV